MANIFSAVSDFFNPNKRMIYYPFRKDNQLETTTRGNTAGNVGSTQAKPNVFNPKPTVQYSSPIGPQMPKAAAPVKPSQPTTPAPSTPSYEQQYANYLKGRTSTANTLAEQAAATAKKNAEDKYNLEKSGLTASVGNLKTGIDTYKKNRAGDVEAFNKVTEGNKENARVESGNTQRTLAMTRRQQLSDAEKRYAALGTIDSYGTGSFTQTNQNVESDFLRMTNQNYANLEDKLAGFDTAAADYKRSADEKVAIEEGKYNDAIIQINKLLAGNEIERGQAIEAANQLLAQKKAEIQYSYDALILEQEKAKADAQKALQAEALKGKQMFAEFQATSPQFQSSGKVTTANDWIFVNKYKDAYASILKNGGTGAAANATANEANDTINLIDEVLGKDLGPVTGLLRVRGSIPGTDAYATQRKIDQIKDKLALAARGQLKGQGQVSDMETRMLKSAVSALDAGMSEQDFVDELNKVKGILQRNSGVAQSPTSGQTVRVMKKDTGETGTIPVSEFDPNLYTQI